HLLCNGKKAGHRPLLPGLPGRAANTRWLRLPQGLSPGAPGTRYPRPPDPRRNQRNHARDHRAPATRKRSRDPMTSPVLFQVLDTADAMKVGVATLNTPQTLNGLSLEMCELLETQLGDWQADESIAMVILKGAGERAFCAGGDLHGLYKSMQEDAGGQAWDNVHARTFFDTEYRLDYLIHTYPKPMLCWGSGIVMGGGVGLMMGASHRVVTETTRFAMPEITIGLFPDVGGSWMLARLPGGTGLFLALTGAQLGHSDCRYLGLADYTLDSGQWEDVVQQIQAESWSKDRSENDIHLGRLLRDLRA